MRIRAKVKWWISCHWHRICFLFFAQEQSFGKANESATVLLLLHSAPCCKVQWSASNSRASQRSTGTDTPATADSAERIYSAYLLFRWKNTKLCKHRTCEFRIERKKINYILMKNDGSLLSILCIHINDWPMLCLLLIVGLSNNHEINSTNELIQMNAHSQKSFLFFNQWTTITITHFI
jgi:hypothetical protein